MPEKPMRGKSPIKGWHIPFLLFLIVGSVLILTENDRKSPKPEYRTVQGKVFGTFYKVTCLSASDMQAVIDSALAGVDASLSMFNDSSTISKVNRGLPAGEDSLFLRIFRKSMEISEATGGAFDITVAPAVNAWGFGFKKAEDITDQKIDSLKEIVGYHKIHEELGHIIKADERMMLDCSAIAKGFGCDEVARALREHGVGNFMVEVGGEVVTGGVNPKGETWNIGISHPDEENESAGFEAIIHLNDGAMATSGNYRNFYVRDGKKYAHTIDPKTCRPVSHSLLSATVLASDCATADAYATSFMVMGADSALSLLAGHPELDAYLIVATDSGNVVLRPQR